MLVLHRKKGQVVVVGGIVRVAVLAIGPDSVRLGFEAPKDVRIDREEIAELWEVPKRRTEDA